jgi:hypothetical protein
VVIAAKKLRDSARWAACVREKFRCRRCGVPVDFKSDNLFTLAHAHEIVFRSHGGDPTDTKNIVILCCRCHLRGLHKQMSPVHEWFRIVIVNEELGADDRDGIRFEPWICKQESVCR